MPPPVRFTIEDFLEVNPESRDKSPDDQKADWLSALAQYTQQEGLGARTGAGFPASKYTGALDRMENPNEAQVADLLGMPTNPGAQGTGEIIGGGLGALTPIPAVTAPAGAYLGGKVGAWAGGQDYDSTQGMVSTGTALAPSILGMPAYLRGRTAPARAMEADNLERQAQTYNAISPGRAVPSDVPGQPIEFPGTNFPVRGPQSPLPGRVGEPPGPTVTREQLERRLIPNDEPGSLAMQTREAFGQTRDAVQRLVGDRMVTVRTMLPEAEAGGMPRQVNINEAMDWIARQSDPILKRDAMRDLVQDLRDQSQGVPTLAARGPAQPSGLLGPNGQPLPPTQTTVQTPQVAPRPEFETAAQILEQSQLPYFESMAARRIGVDAMQSGTRLGNPNVSGGGPFAEFQRAVAAAAERPMGLPRGSATEAINQAQRQGGGVTGQDVNPGFALNMWHRLSGTGMPGVSFHPKFTPGQMVGTPETLANLNYRAPSAGYVPLGIGLSQQLLNQMRGVGQ